MMSPLRYRMLNSTALPKNKDCLLAQLTSLSLTFSVNITSLLRQPTFCPSRHWLLWIDRPPPSSPYPWLHSHSPTATCFVPVSLTPLHNPLITIISFHLPVISTHRPLKHTVSLFPLSFMSFHCTLLSFPCKSSHRNIKLNPSVLNEVPPYLNKTTNVNNTEFKYDHMPQQYQKPSMAPLVEGLAQNCCCIQHSLLF
jgi:hypothetical protein